MEQNVVLLKIFWSTSRSLAGHENVGLRDFRKSKGNADASGLKSEIKGELQ